MKTIVAVIGTPHAQQSATVSLVTGFLDLVRERDSAVTYEILSLGAARVAPCNGCWTCSRTGTCPLADDLPAIQAKLLAADAVILGSPVHATHVSAQTKAFIDRSFLWAHTIRLIGKPSLTAVTAAFSDMTETETYLSNMLVALGTLPMGGLRRNPFIPEPLAPREACIRDYGTLADRLIAVLDGRATLTPTPQHAAVFEGIKGMVQGIPGGYAKGYWESRHWFDKDFIGALDAA